MVQERLAARVSPGFSWAIPALLLAMVLWGGTYVITRGALEHADPFTVLFLRLAIAGVALYPFARRQGFRLKDAAKPAFVWFGITGMVLHLGFEIVGLRFTSASSAALVIATAPAVTAIASIWFLGEKMTRARWIAVALSVVGVVLISSGATTGGYPLAWLGNLLVFGGVVMWAVFTVQGKRMPSTVTPLFATTAATISAAVLSLPIAAGEIALRGWPMVTAGGTIAMLYLGLAASAGAYGLWNLALRDVDASVAGPFINLVPVLGVAIALLVGETLTPLQLIGGAVVAVGVAFSYRAR